METLLEKRRQWFAPGSYVRFRTTKSEVLGEVVEIIGDSTLCLKHFRILSNGYTGKGRETYCVPLDSIFWVEPYCLE